MKGRKFVTGLLMVCFIWPNLSWAQTLSVGERQFINEQIKILLTQIQLLQAELDRLKEKERPVVRGTHDTSIFDVEVESAYQVSDGTLRRIDERSSVRPIDAQLFALFLKVVDEETLNKYVKEWRVFHDPSIDLGGYVQLEIGTDDWVLAVNREGYRDSRLVNLSYVHLFIHELAHIWHFYEQDQVDSFEKRFWTDADFRHSQAVQEGGRQNQFERLSKYYNQNPTRFVSDYATYSVEEDMAETFVEFVFENKPSGVSAVDKKILFFYEDAKWQMIRSELRSRLKAEGWL